MGWKFRFALAWVLLGTSSLGWAQSKVKTLHLNFTSVQVPGAGVTLLEGVNTLGDMVGTYAGSSNGPYHSFLLTGGQFTYFDYPGLSSVAYDINDSGLIVGTAGDIDVRGFLYDGTTFTDLQRDGDTATSALGLDNAGDIVGGTGTPGSTIGFEWTDGHFVLLSPPRSNVYVYDTGINNIGEVVGWTSSGLAINSFFYKQGKFQKISVSGANQIEAWSVNDSEIVVGWYGLGSSTNGFAWRNGKSLSFSYPGAIGTFPRGINSSGQIVGEYTFDYITYFGFYTTPLTTTDFER